MNQIMIKILNFFKTNKSEYVKLLKDENKNLSTEISKLKIQILSYENLKTELNDLYLKYNKLKKESNNIDTNDIKILIDISMKMQKILMDCKKELLPIKLSKDIDRIMKQIKDLG